MLDVYSLCKSEKPALVIYDSPHSGSIYPDDFNHNCDLQTLRACEDNYVDELYAHVQRSGASLLCAHFPRSYIDPNRSKLDIDPLLLQGSWIGEIEPSIRSEAGHGLIRRLVNPTLNLYNRSLTQQEIQSRIDRYYTPYHDQLENLINEAYDHYGQAWHINCHSMPNEAAKPNRPIGFMAGQRQSADFVLGDRNGISCDPNFTRALHNFLQDLGYTVTINDPFKGVELISRYAQPARGIHSIQIEMNKSLYMNEDTLEKHKGFDQTCKNIKKLTQFIKDYTHNRLKE